GGFAVPGATGSPRDLVHWGNSGFAFATSGDQVVITSAAFTSPANPNLDQLQVNHLVYDPGRNKIYASVPSLNGARGNTVSIIDPPTASIESSIFVGSEPNAMALSKDGSYLYVGLDGTGAVRKVDLATRTAGLQFGLGADSFFGPMYAADIAVMPGNPNTVAISRRYSGVSPQHAGVAIYDNGVPRPNTTPGHTGSNVIEFSDSPSNLYGYNNETTEFGFRRMNVDANGVSVIDTNSNLISGFGVNIAHDSGMIYATTGAIVDPVADTLLGRFPDVNYSSGVLPDKAAGRVYFLSTASGGNAAIAAYDKSTFAQIGSIAVPGARGTGRDFVRWGTSGFAVATASQVLITSGLLPQPKPVEITTTALPPTMNGKRYDFTLASAGGAAPVRWALIAVGLPPGLSLSSQGRISGTVGNADATTYSFTVQVTDAATPAASATKNLSVLVKTGLGGNNYCATATPASFGRISASLSPYGDIDVYSFDGVAGASITIETFAQRLDLDGDPTTVDSQADTVLELLDSSCSQLAINDDLSSAQLDSRIAGYALPYTGKYYVRVSDSRGDGRPDLLYDLSLSRE
ncbi:MAG TPA: putative Ig domain-containing protein, partial [Terriglobales bacterium]|nr:putative Ig domain-containing protein [Terriglobales bacterium]